MTATRTDPWACPDAVEVTPHGTGRGAWLAARRGGIGGSDAATVAGLNPWSSRYELYLDKTGQLPERHATSAMEWGLRLEPVIADWFVEHTGRTLRPAGLLAHRDRPWQIGTVDRLVDCGGILEVKTTSWRLAHEWDDDQTPDAAELQTQHYLAVTGRSHAHVAVLVDGRDPLLREIVRDDALIETLTEIEREFWHEFVLARREPPIDGSEATADALDRRWPADDGSTVAVDAEVLGVLGEWETAKADLAAAEHRVRHARSRIAALVGPAETATVHGDPVLTLRANGAFSTRAFTAEHPELAEALTTERPALDLARLKAEHPDLYRHHRARVLRRVNPIGANRG